MKARYALLTSLVLTVFILQGCTHPEEERALVEIPNLESFDPDPIEVEAGTTVMWRNTDNQAHTATDANETWDSDTLSPGDTWEREFDEPGEYTYFCRFHATVDQETGECSGQCGTIVVTEPESE